MGRVIPFAQQLRKESNGCWLWTGARSGSGYGVHQHQAAHRYSYEQEFGPIPAGHIICHTCDTPACVNPAHLWVGTPSDNARDASLKGRCRGQSQTHCRHGHEFTPENTYRRPGTLSGRDCRACIRARVARYAAKRNPA